MAKSWGSKTRYFHAFASSRLKRNAVLVITHDEQQVTNQHMIRDLFLQQMQRTLGQSVMVKRFKPQVLYQNNLNLMHLSNPIQESEIEMAIKGLANNKASGSNGILNKFLKAYWPSLKSEICNIVWGFFNNQIGLSSINLANVVTIPKTDSPQTVGDFRPISIINIVPKLISKIIANRLGNSMQDLISPYQTVFIKGRQITDNFVATREILQHISFSKRFNFTVSR